MNLLRRSKKNYFANINISSVTDNTKFWKTVKPLFSDKISHQETINLVENNTVLNNDQVFADTCNNCFNNIIKNLLSLTNKNFPKKKQMDLDPIEVAILKYNNYVSLNAIRGKISILDNPRFSF